jgi:hypothetical protein
VFNRREDEEAIQEDKPGQPFSWRHLIQGWALGAAIVLPWYLFVFYHTGNPIWPTFPEYSQGIWGSPEVVRNANAWLENAGQTRTFRNFFMLSFDWINHPARFQAENNLSLFPLVTVWPLTWVVALWNRSVRWWAVWALAFTLFWFLHPQLLRYWLPAFPLAIIALGESLRWLVELISRSVILHRVIWVALACVAVLWGGRTIASELKYKGLPPTDQSQREAFLSGLAGYRAVKYVNQQAEEDETVCVINASFLNYYLKPRKLDLFSLLHAPKLPKFRWPDDALWVRWLESQNAVWILINHANAPNYLALPKQDLATNPYWPDYELAYSDPVTWVFRRKPDKEMSIDQPLATIPNYEGYHDITNCNGIMGWAWDKNNPGAPVEVDIYDGDLLLATVTASDFRQDLLNAGIGNGNHGFTYPFPSELKDGRPHSIRMKFAGTEIDLNNTPKLLTCALE